MKVPEVKVENFNLAFASISGHMPDGLICEKLTISMTTASASWTALCIATDSFPTPKDPANYEQVKQILQTNFGQNGVVKNVQTVIRNQPNGYLTYKWQVLIDPRPPRPKAFGVYLHDTVNHYLESSSDHIHDLSNT